MPFLDTLIIRKPDGSVKLCIYRKKTHTDQYLQFSSHHALHQKLGVIRTLLDRKDSIVTEESDRRDEELRITNALSECGYPKWAVSKVKQERQNPKPKISQKKANDADKTKGLVVVPYVAGITERVTRVFRKHGFSVASKPHKTLKSYLVHPKDKLDPLQKADAIYDIPCANCPKSYVGETGRSFGVRLEEHKKDVKKFEDKPYTRAARAESTSEQHKSAITDHVVETNHSIEWDSAKVIDRESDKTTRWLKEAIWIRRRGDNVMNRDEGAYKLNTIFDQLITTPTTAVSKVNRTVTKSRRKGCQSDESDSLSLKRH